MLPYPQISYVPQDRWVNDNFNPHISSWMMMQSPEVERIIDRARPLDLPTCQYDCIRKEEILYLDFEFRRVTYPTCLLYRRHETSDIRALTILLLEHCGIDLTYLPPGAYDSDIMRFLQESVYGFGPQSPFRSCRMEANYLPIAYASSYTRYWSLTDVVRFLPKHPAGVTWLAQQAAQIREAQQRLRAESKYLAKEDRPSHHIPAATYEANRRKMNEELVAFMVRDRAH